MGKKIVLTGGGTAGHVTPHIALLPSLREADFDIRYIGSYEGIEKTLMEQEGIAYDGVATGKFRRYFDWKNFSDPFQVIKGYFEAKKLIKEYDPDVVFSKGGFVAVPVVWAAAGCHIPVVIHESDMSPGLANKLCIKKAYKICANFPEALSNLPTDKSVVTGTPIREELLHGSREAGLSFCGFAGDKPVLMMMGGSTGAKVVNSALREALPRLLETFDVIHLCGKGNLDSSLQGVRGYAQFEYISDELKDLFAAADIMLSRAGANSICEILALKKPNVLVPLSASVSRGDQILNAESFRKQGFSYVLPEEKMNADSLIEAIRHVYDNRVDYVRSMEYSAFNDGIRSVMREIDAAIRENPKRNKKRFGV
ncbi:MAG: undecaprenyldiphospho-muramoylpentapeptide beta-N-acetylglucosaminyltransferase [Lachnospiraceae bacterium]|nr:undecaprenyldiphospho-muramoylpentapeptide beta-N-acetylglucosaminyltransferase [Lachnospiraceae bacterium]